MMGPKFEVVADTLCQIGENPLWHSDEERLYWCDLPRGDLYRYEPLTGRTEIVRTGTENGGMIGGFTIEADGALLLFMESGKVTRWKDGLEELVLGEIPRERGSRFNDVIADSEGGVFCGTMSTDCQTGRLYRLNLNHTFEKIAENLKCSNGLAFSTDRKNLFLTDSLAHTIYIFDYDTITGKAGNQRVFLKTDPELGCPDGLTIDAEGYFWSALWDGGCVLRYGEDGQYTLRINVPARKTASLTFGGTDLSTLFVVSAGGESRKTEGAYAGALFAARLGVRGVPEFRSRICCSGFSARI